MIDFSAHEQLARNILTSSMLADGIPIRMFPSPLPIGGRISQTPLTIKIQSITARNNI